jgi:3D (Asp-Asp-Asp) domain-containing protein
MFLSHSWLWKIVATLGAVVGFVFVYETTIPDSRHAMLAETPASPQPGGRLHYTATAYCKGETTASGVTVRTGIAAADPTLLPVGTVVRLDMPDSRYDGIWTIMDTGPAVQGRIVDLYLWSCHEALRFGRRPIELTVLRLGWNPQNSEPGRAETLYRQREIERTRLPLPAKPIDPATLVTPPVVPAVVSQPSPPPS